MIYEKIAYAKRHARKQKADVQDMVTEQSEDDNISRADLLEFFKTCALPRDELKVKKKFQETVAFRMKDDFNNEAVVFNFYLVLPDMVS